ALAFQAVLEAIEAVKIWRGCKEWLFRVAVETASREAISAQPAASDAGCPACGVLATFEGVLDEAGQSLGLERKATGEDVRKLLVQAGQKSLAKEWVDFRAGRRACGHPSSGVAERVIRAISTLDKSGVDLKEMGPKEEEFVQDGEEMILECGVTEASTESGSDMVSQSLENFDMNVEVVDSASTVKLGELEYSPVLARSVVKEKKKKVKKKLPPDSCADVLPTLASVDIKTRSVPAGLDSFDISDPLMLVPVCEMPPSTPVDYASFDISDTQIKGSNNSDRDVQVLENTRSYTGANDSQKPGEVLKDAEGQVVKLDAIEPGRPQSLVAAIIAQYGGNLSQEQMKKYVSEAFLHQARLGKVGTR
ncbi:unnamed protein product, partial [Prorocentrum cordatum]